MSKLGRGFVAHCSRTMIDGVAVKMFPPFEKIFCTYSPGIPMTKKVLCRDGMMCCLQAELNHMKWGTEAVMDRRGEAVHFSADSMIHTDRILLFCGVYTTWKEV